MGDACIEESLRFDATLLLPCAMLHAQVIRDVLVQSPVLFLHWKRCQAFRKHGAIALESTVIDFLFYTSNETPSCNKRYRASKEKGYLKR